MSCWWAERGERSCLSCLLFVIGSGSLAVLQQVHTSLSDIVGGALRRFLGRAYLYYYENSFWLFILLFVWVRLEHGDDINIHLRKYYDGSDESANKKSNFPIVQNVEIKKSLSSRQVYHNRIIEPSRSQPVL